MMKVFAVSCLLALAGAAPKPEAEADPQFLAAAPYAAAVAAPAVVPAANCKTDTEILVTQSCAPSAENVCTKQTVDTEEIEYEKVCKEVVDTICDAPAAVGYIGRREAEAETDPQYVRYAAHAVAPVAATAVAHSDQCHCQVALPQTSSR